MSCSCQTRRKLAIVRSFSCSTSQFWHSLKFLIAALTEDAGKVAQLLLAASQGDVAKMSTLLEGGLNVNSGDYDQRTGLHLAAVRKIRVHVC